VFASLALLFLWVWLVGEVISFGEDVAPTYFGDSFAVTGTEADFTDPFATPEPVPRDDDSLEVGVLSALLGGGYLLAMRGLDRRGLAGVATAFAVPGVAALAVSVGSLGEASGELVVGGLLGVGAGVFAAWCAAVTRRRFTTWAGASLGAVGALLVAIDLSGTDGDDEGIVALGALTSAAGLALMALSWPIRALSGEPERGDDEGPTSEPPPG
jgi:hypothetical protein